MNEQIFNANYHASRTKLGTATLLWRLFEKLQGHPQFDDFLRTCFCHEVGEDARIHQFGRQLWEAELSALLISGQLKAVALPIQFLAHHDENVRQNQQNLLNTNYFKDVFVDKTTITNRDGYVSCHDWLKNELGLTFNQYQLEIGYCRPHQIFRHLWSGGAVCRYPYNFKKILLIEPTETFLSENVNLKIKNYYKRYQQQEMLLAA